MATQPFDPSVFGPTNPTRQARLTRDLPVGQLTSAYNGAFTPSDPAAPIGQSQWWTNNQTGQRVYGTINPANALYPTASIAVHDPNTGQLTSQNMDASGKQADRGSFTKDALIGAGIAGGVLTGGLLAPAFFGGGGAAAGGAAATEGGALPVGTAAEGVATLQGAVPAVSLGAAPAATIGATAAGVPSMAVSSTPAADLQAAAPSSMTSLAAPPSAAPSLAGSTAAGAGSSLIKNPWVRFALGTGAAGAQTWLANSAINKALKQQQAATNQALGINSQIYTNSLNYLAPYRGIGANATTTLGGLLGLSGAGGSQGNAPIPSAPTGTTATTNQPMMVGGSLTPGTLNPATGQRATTIGGVALPSASPLVAQAMQPLPTQTPDTVPVRAPNGQTYMVPRMRVNEALGQGGQVVS